MTTVSQIIKDAFRASNLTATEAAPTTNEQTEALRYLSRIVKSTFGNEAGEDFTNVPIGSLNITRPSGYPWYDQVPDDSDWFVPENVRLMVNSDEATTLYLHPDPDDGARFAVIDVAGNLATYNLTINGNGRNIESASSVTLSTNGESAEWFYRGDTGNWVKYAALALDDTFPFPEEFDDYFIMTLAMRLNPGYGRSLDGQAMEIWRRSRSQLRARYSVDIEMPSERALLRLSKMTADRGRINGTRDAYNPQRAFTRGWPY